MLITCPLRFQLAAELKISYESSEGKIVVDKICEKLEQAGMADDNWEDDVISQALKSAGLRRYRIQVADLMRMLKTDTQAECLSSQTTGGTPSSRALCNDADGSTMHIKIEDPDIIACKEKAKVLRTGESKLSACLKTEKAAGAKLTAMNTTESIVLSN